MSTPTWDNCFKTPTTWARVRLLSASPVATAAMTTTANSIFQLIFMTDDSPKP